MKPFKVESFTSRMGDLAEVLKDVPTPLSHADLDGPTYQDSVLDEIDSSLRISAMRFGSVYGFAQEQNGKTVQNLFPIKGDETVQISSSSDVALEMHTETAFHPWSPEVVMLLCLRDDPNAGTVLASLPDIIDELDQETFRLLHLPEFVTQVDDSFRSNGMETRDILTPVLFNRGTAIKYDRALMSSITEAGTRALSTLSNVIDKVSETVFLKTNNVLLLKNTAVIHGRTPFKARYDGTDRWLKRVMVSTQFPTASQYLPDWSQMEIRDGRHRVITTQF